MISLINLLPWDSDPSIDEGRTSTSANLLKFKSSFSVL